MRSLRYIGISLIAALPLFALAQGTGQSSDFVPLLPSLPGISTLTQSDELAPFLTQLYKICIGVAAVVAVLQLILAGVQYMGGDSVTEKSDARNRITMSIIGLLLVLMPVIVFSIINPKILNLDLNVGSLQQSLDHIRSARTTPVQIAVTSAEQCREAGGTVTGDGAGFTCMVPGNSAAATAAYNTCTNYENVRAVPGAVCSSPTATTTPTSINIPTTCCSGIQAGSVCCGARKAIAPTTDATLPVVITTARYTATAQNFGPVSAADWNKRQQHLLTCTRSPYTGMRTTIEGSARTCTGAEFTYANVPENMRQGTRCVETRLTCQQ